MTCDSCDRAPYDWITVNGVRWIPELEKTAGGRMMCWECRQVPHSDMPDDYLPDDFFDSTHTHA